MAILNASSQKKDSVTRSNTYNFIAKTDKISKWMEAIYLWFDGQKETISLAAGTDT